jgi:hypothetical protein
MSRVAVVCAEGIGDGLLMQIAANFLRKQGLEVVTFSNALPSLADWFPGFAFAPQPKLDEIERQFASFDEIVLEYDNSPKAKKIRDLPKPVYTLFGSYDLAKHGPFREGVDVRLDRSICMAENIAKAMHFFFGEKSTLENGLVPPPHLVRQKFPKRVAIHSSSTLEEKNWLMESFLKLQTLLKQEGWDPVFMTTFPTLSDLAAFLYESGYLIGNDSGPGHLASNLGLPTVTIGSSKKHLSFWRPGWQRGEIAHPPAWLPKSINWKKLISVNHVNKKFKKLTDIK